MCKEKMRNSTELKYGVTHYSQTQEYKEKWQKTCEERYGSDYRKQFINKAFETFHAKTGYGYPSQSPEVRKKIIKSYIDHYGVDNPQLSLEVRKQAEKTCLERYGYTTPLQSKEVKEKIAQSFYENGTVPTSKQQFYLFNLYKSIDDSIRLNYPISYFNADICFLKEKLDIELDCGGHNLSVKTGQLTQEQFDKKELIRNKAVKNEGYKIIRIKSKTDKLPCDEILLQMLNKARRYFSEYPNHSWIEYDIDNSIVRNAERKDGVQYNYGELRKIKNSDLI
jgi:very-short-patch-repair endonuclease